MERLHYYNCRDSFLYFVIYWNSLLARVFARVIAELKLTCSCFIYVTTALLYRYQTRPERCSKFKLIAKANTTRKKTRQSISGCFFNKTFKYNDSSNWNTYLTHADRNIDFRFIQNNQNILILNRNLLELNQGILTTFEVN